MTVKGSVLYKAQVRPLTLSAYVLVSGVPLGLPTAFLLVFSSECLKSVCVAIALSVRASNI